MPSFCAQCGTKQTATDKFCANCGAPDGAAAPAPSAPPYTAAAPPPYNPAASVPPYNKMGGPAVRAFVCLLGVSPRSLRRTAQRPASRRKVPPC
jgi:predicted amidophosphoribosyltransferase